MAPKLFYLGEIPRRNDFENKTAIGYIKNSRGKLEPDYLSDDSALAYKSEKGIVIITGCSHSGICNIVEHAKEVCNDERVADIIGGFHLLDVDNLYMEQVLNYFSKQEIAIMHPCHCTDLKAKMSLATILPVSDTGVGEHYVFN